MKRMIMDTPIGKLELIEQDGLLKQISFEESFHDDIVLEQTEFLKNCCQQLEEYFSHKRTIFEIPILLEGTEFQKCVWKNLQKIPYGELWSYQKLACLIGNKNACRAVGMANHFNPLPIVIPCHRIVGKNGSLVGYRGGLQRKKQLISLENEK